MRVRLTLGAALLAAVAALALELSVRAQRTIATNHVNAAVFAATLPGGSTLCQPGTELPNDARGLRLMVGTYGRALPALTFTMTQPSGKVLAVGRSRRQARQGEVVLPVRPTNHTLTGELCIHSHGTHKIVLGGESSTPGESSAQLDGQPLTATLAIAFMSKRESWWGTLPGLATRMGYGKASIFGAWTLPLAALLLAAIWMATSRLLARESSP